MLHCEEEGVICAADVRFASLRRAEIKPLLGRALLVELGDFRVGEKLPPGILVGSLQRYLVLVGPDALQVRVAPRCLGNRRAVGSRRRRRRSGRGLARGNGCQLEQHDDDDERTPDPEQ